MAYITLRQATEEEKRSCQFWELWESGEAEIFEYTYDQDVQFIVQKGEAVIHSVTDKPVAIQPGSHVTIRKGFEGRWAINSPITNRYQYF